MLRTWKLLQPPPAERCLHLLQDATEEQVERMNGSCAVCWGEMGAPLPRAAMRLLGAGPPGPPAPLDAHAPVKALPCAHAFHTAFIRKWLKQCHWWVHILALTMRFTS